MLLEDFVPYDQSLLWRIHHAYFEARGIDAWRQGDIPYSSINSYPMARQHARFCVSLVVNIV